MEYLRAFSEFKKKNRIESSLIEVALNEVLLSINTSFKFNYRQRVKLS